MTHEEKDVLLFFEETIDSLEEDLEEQTLYDSGIHCHSPKSMEENMSSLSESEDIIDLVQPSPTNTIQESVHSRTTGKCCLLCSESGQSGLDKPNGIPNQQACLESMQHL